MDQILTAKRHAWIWDTLVEAVTQNICFAIAIESNEILFITFKSIFINFSLSKKKYFASISEKKNRLFEAKMWSRAVKYTLFFTN